MSIYSIYMISIPPSSSSILPVYLSTSYQIYDFFLLLLLLSTHTYRQIHTHNLVNQFNVVYMCICIGLITWNWIAYYPACSGKKMILPPSVDINFI